MLCPAGDVPCDAAAVELGTLLLAGVDPGVGEGVGWPVLGLGTAPAVGVDVGVGTGASGADGTGEPPPCTTCNTQ